MARRTKAAPEPFDRELADLPPELRWREWMGRVEAAIFASPTPVPHESSRPRRDTCSLDDVIADIQDELRARPYELVFVAGGWHHRTRPRFADAIRTSRVAEGRARLDLSPATRRARGDRLSPAAHPRRAEPGVRDRDQPRPHRAGRTARHFQTIWLLAKGHELAQVSATVSYARRWVEIPWVRLVAPGSLAEWGC